jgi:hypothetical protein
VPTRRPAQAAIIIVTAKRRIVREATLRGRAVEHQVMNGSSDV